MKRCLSETLCLQISVVDLEVQDAGMSSTYSDPKSMYNHGHLGLGRRLWAIILPIVGVHLEAKQRRGSKYLNQDYSSPTILIIPNIESQRPHYIGTWTVRAN